MTFLQNILAISIKSWNAFQLLLVVAGSWTNDCTLSEQLHVSNWLLYLLWHHKLAYWWSYWCECKSYFFSFAFFLWKNRVQKRHLSTENSCIVPILILHLVNKSCLYCKLHRRSLLNIFNLILLQFSNGGP